MTKQKEIREGIEARIRLGIIETTYETANEILSYLHSQGVVIKVERELPEAFMKAGGIPLEALKEFRKAGFVAWEPLIKEGL